MKIEILKKAKKFILNQPASQQRRLLQAIFCLPVGDVKPLKGTEQFFRLRTGEYRVIFTIEEDTIIVRDAGPRGDVYKG